MKKVFSWLFLALISSYTVAQDRLISATTISNKTMLLHFDEGEKDLTNFKEYYIYDAPNQVYHGQINEVQALLISNYTIQSNEDANYETPQVPLAIYFKAKKQKGLFEYWVYVEFPSQMQEDATYTIAVSNIGANQASYQITANAFNNISESIHVNQIGMIADAGKKYAYVSQWLGKSSTQISTAEILDV